MHEERSRNSASSQLEIEFTDRTVTPYGGMALLMEYFKGSASRPCSMRLFTTRGRRPTPPT